GRADVGALCRGGRRRRRDPGRVRAGGTRERLVALARRSGAASPFEDQGDAAMAAGPAEIVLGAPAPNFRLPATDGKTYGLSDVAGDRATVIVFICNHCPYVRAVIDRLVADARVLMAEGVGFAAICSNDAASYPEDSFDNMKRFADAHGFVFPYLHDAEQTAARAYGAVCTPDFFGYDAERKLSYRG